MAARSSRRRSSHRDWIRACRTRARGHERRRADALRCRLRRAAERVTLALVRRRHGHGCPGSWGPRLVDHGLAAAGWLQPLRRPVARSQRGLSDRVRLANGVGESHEPESLGDEPHRARLAGTRHRAFVLDHTRVREERGPSVQPGRKPSARYHGRAPLHPGVSRRHLSAFDTRRGVVEWGSAQLLRRRCRQSVRAVGLRPDELPFLRRQHDFCGGLGHAARRHPGAGAGTVARGIDRFRACDPRLARATAPPSMSLTG